MTTIQWKSLRWEDLEFHLSGRLVLRHNKHLQYGYTQLGRLGTVLGNPAGICLHLRRRLENAGEVGAGDEAVRIDLMLVGAIGFKTHNMTRLKVSARDRSGPLAHLLLRRDQALSCLLDPAAKGRDLASVLLADGAKLDGVGFDGVAHWIDRGLRKAI